MDKDNFDNLQGIKKALKSAQKQFLPPPNLKPSEWAERNVRIPIGNAVPGLIRFDNAPYQREPLDMTDNPNCNRVTLMFAAQVGKTLLGLCAQAYRIGQNPTSQIMCQPSQGDLQTWLETKFNPMVEANPELESCIAKPRGREGVNNQRMKSYYGGFMMFSWSGSPKTMRGRSAPFVVCDETDGYDRTGEGHPVSLLQQRSATFGQQRMLLEISTPTFKGSSWIEDAFEAGDKRRFYVLCPHCKTPQTLKWANVMWDKTDTEHDPSTARYMCTDCGSLWDDGERIAAIRNAERHGAGWKAEKPFKGHASYHLNELYSVFRRLEDIVTSFLEKKAANDLQTFVNVSLAETWEEDGEQIDEHGLYERREPMDAIPDDVATLFAGVDVQDNRLELSIVGMGRGEELYIYKHLTLYGDPSTPQLWTALDSHLFAQYQTESGRKIAIRAAAVDSGGHFTNSVYAYCKKNAGRKVFAIKGAGGEGKPISSRPSKNNVAKCPLFSIGVDTAKDLIFARLRITDMGPGYVHFAEGLDEEYFRQLTAEKVVTRYQKGFKRRVYEKIRPRNEALDCLVYAYAAYAIIGINVNALADRLEHADDENVDTAPQPKPKQRPFVPPTGKNFINSWR